MSNMVYKNLEKEASMAGKAKVIDADSIDESTLIERIVIDPETGRELLFKGADDNELDGLIDDYFDPFYDHTTGKYLD